MPCCGVVVRPMPCLCLRMPGRLHARERFSLLTHALRSCYAQLFFELVHNRLAFRGDNMAQLQVRILRGSHQAFPSSTSSRVRTAVKRMLTVDVSERPSAERVTRALALNFGLEQGSSGQVVLPVAK